MRPNPSQRGALCAAAPALLLCLSVTSCTLANSDNSSLSVHTATWATSASTPPVVAGRWMIYFADEASSGATVLNGDGDANDAVAVAVALDKNTETSMGAAAYGAAALGNELFLAVSEAADGVDWNLDSDQSDFVLLNWPGNSAGPLSYVDDLADSDLPFVSVGTRLFYAAPAPGLGVDETALRYVTQNAPTAPVAVLHADGGSLSPTLIGASNGLVFAAVSETTEGVDLNGDGAQDGDLVLALLDGTASAKELKLTGLALDSAESPIAAQADGVGDWLVAFLVSEAAQGKSLNDPTDLSNNLPAGWVPENCAGAADADEVDQVLHCLHFASWFAGSADPINTGLAGGHIPSAGNERVLVVGDYVATLENETDAGCDLNDDGVQNDRVPRWALAATPMLPPGLIAQMRAVADVEGGSHGLAYLSDRLVAVIGEAEQDADLDGDPADHDLVAWLAPTDGSGAGWHVQHSSSAVGTGITGLNYAGAAWLAAEPQLSRLGLAFQEQVAADVLNQPNLSLNNCLGTGLFVKDADATDQLPVWSDFESGPSLDFDGIGYALSTNNAGIVLASGKAFFRVSESNDALSYNAGNGDLTDDVLITNPIAQGCDAVVLGTSAPITGPVVITDGLTGAGFFSSESQAGLDFDGDGDQADLVVRWFHY